MNEPYEDNIQHSYPRQDQDNDFELSEDAEPVRRDATRHEEMEDDKAISDDLKH